MSVAASAAPKAPAKAPVQSSLQKDVSDLKTQVGTLVQQQQKILDQLDQLKTLIQNQQANAAPAAQPQPPQPQYPSTLDIGSLPVEGDNGAHVAIVEFTDFQCPFCGRYMSDAFPQIYSNYIKTGKVKYYYRDFPLSFHEFAAPAAKAAHCAGEQGKFWEMHDSLFANQTALGQQDIVDRAKKMGLDTAKFSQCIASDKFDQEMQTSENQANGWGVNGTPTFFIGIIGSDGKVMSVDKTIVGAQPFDAFRSAIDAELAPHV
jgi:protein-disulfide isomerase